MKPKLSGTLLLPKITNKKLRFQKIKNYGSIFLTSILGERNIFKKNKLKSFKAIVSIQLPIVSSRQNCS
jgi:hypothetical protein